MLALGVKKILNLQNSTRIMKGQAYTIFSNVIVHYVTREFARIPTLGTWYVLSSAQQT